MKRIVRDNICVPYTLHDMNVFAFEISDNDIIMKTQSGIIETINLGRQVEGYVEFYDVQWNFCYVYLLGVTGNIGNFTGEKMFLKDFIDKYKQFGFSVMDETYGYNMTKYCGYLISGGKFCECIIEIYHEGDMVFVAEE